MIISVSHVRPEQVPNQQAHTGRGPTCRREIITCIGPGFWQPHTGPTRIGNFQLVQKTVDFAEARCLWLTSGWQLLALHTVTQSCWQISEATAFCMHVLMLWPKKRQSAQSPEPFGPNWAAFERKRAKNQIGTHGLWTGKNNYSSMDLLNVACLLDLFFLVNETVVHKMENKKMMDGFQPDQESHFIRRPAGVCRPKQLGPAWLCTRNRSLIAWFYHGPAHSLFAHREVSGWRCVSAWLAKVNYKLKTLEHDTSRGLCLQKAQQIRQTI